MLLVQKMAAYRQPSEIRCRSFRSRKMPAVDLRITANSSPIPQVPRHRHLGIYFKNNIDMVGHGHAISKASEKIGLLRRLSSQPLILPCP